MSQNSSDNKLNDATGVDDSTTCAKVCTGCQAHKLVEDFYRKGARYDSRCKSCVLSDKQKRRKAKRRNKKPFGGVLVVSNLKIEEIESNNPNTDMAHLESLLRQFTFVSICRKDENNE